MTDELEARLRAAIDEAEAGAKWRLEDVAQYSQAEIDPTSILRLCRSHRDILEDYKHARHVRDRLLERDCSVGLRVVQQRAVNALERVVKALARGYGLKEGGPAA